MNRIKELRQAKGWLQKDLEKAVNLGRGNISKYEKEERELSPSLIRQLCEVFGCTSDYLLGISSQRTMQITDADAALVEAYHAAAPDARQIVDLALGLGKIEEKNKSAVS